MASYVDNLLVAGKDASAAEALLEMARRRFERVWNLALPEESVGVVVLRGAGSGPAHCSAKHSIVFLGQVLSGDGSVARCWRKAQLRLCCPLAAACDCPPRAPSSRGAHEAS